MTDVLIAPEIEKSVEDGDEDLITHVAPRSAIRRSRLTGTPVQALCGKVWVPQHYEPHQFEVCEVCMDLWLDVA